MSYARGERATWTPGSAPPRAAQSRRSWSPSSTPPAPAKAHKLPSSAEPTPRRSRRSKKAYPSVKEISPWNEVNRCQLPSRAARASRSATTAKLAGAYYTVARKRLQGQEHEHRRARHPRPAQRRARRCQATSSDFLRYAKPRPKSSGIHNYTDTNRFSTTRTKACPATTQGQSLADRDRRSSGSGRRSRSAPRARPRR